MQKQKTELTWLHYIVIGCFLGYLAFANGSVDGNSLLIASAGIACILFGLFQMKWLRKRMNQKLGVVEIDLTDQAQQDKGKHFSDKG